MIAIIDYGMGNIHSVQKALEALGGQVKVTSNPLDIEGSEKIVLPGVGAFDDAMTELKRRGLITAIHAHVRKKKAFLGICLGMQLLFDSSEEARGARGLGILKGAVKRFTPRRALKVPHMGWNQLRIRRKDCPLLKGVRDNAEVYFCHSYYPRPSSIAVSAAETSYGKDFVSLVWQENIYGVQFHPEKSQKAGLAIVRNFIELC